MVERERERANDLGWGKRKGCGGLSIASVERKREWERDEERGEGAREGCIFWDKSPKYKPSRTMLYKAKVGVNFRRCRSEIQAFSTMECEKMRTEKWGEAKATATKKRKEGLKSDVLRRGCGETRSRRIAS